MAREPSPIRDLFSLFALVTTYIEVRPEVTAYATPKASLLAAIASWITGTRRRVYQIWGLRLETTRGPQRAVLTTMEALTSRLSSTLLANSRSLALEYEELGLNHSRPVVTIGQGSSHGVDLETFSPDTPRAELDEGTRDFLSSSSGMVVGFVGRVHPDKGIDTLLKASAICGGLGTPLRVLIVGWDEGAFKRDLPFQIPANVRLHYTGAVDDTRPYFASMDVLVLMSRREGFPNVVLEAAAMGVPAIVSNATGAVDSVIDGQTGIIVHAGDAQGVANSLSLLSADRSRLRELGRMARAHVESNYSQATVWSKTATFLTSSEVG